MFAERRPSPVAIVPDLELDLYLPRRDSDPPDVADRMIALAVREILYARAGVA